MAEQINQLESSEQIQSIKQQDSQIQTVESFLQGKISDPDTQNKIIPIFTDIKKDISDNDILQFLQSNNLNLLVRRSKSLDNKDAKDFLIGSMMDYFQTIGKSISVINTVEENNTKAEENNTKAEENNTKAEENNTKAEKKGTVDKESLALDNARQETKDEYGRLDAKFKLTAEQTEKWKTTLQTDGTLGQLEKDFSGDQNKINDFINFSYTANTFPDAPEVAPFKQKYEELKSLTGVIENAHDLSGMKAPDTLLRDNDDLRSYADNADNPAFAGISKFEYFKELKMDTKQSEKILSFADEKIQQMLAEQKKSLIENKAVDVDMNPTENITEDMQKNLTTYNQLLSSTLGAIQEKLQNDSQSIMRERTVTTPIQGLAGYFDFTIINGKSFSRDLKLGENAFSHKVEVCYNLFDIL